MPILFCPKLLFSIFLHQYSSNPIQYQQIESTGSKTKLSAISGDQANRISGEVYIYIYAETSLITYVTKQHSGDKIKVTTCWVKTNVPTEFWWRDLYEHNHLEEGI